MGSKSTIVELPKWVTRSIGVSSCTALLLRSHDFAHVRLDLGNDMILSTKRLLPRHVRFLVWGSAPKPS